MSKYDSQAKHRHTSVTEDKCFDVMIDESESLKHTFAARSLSDNWEGAFRK